MVGEYGTVAPLAWKKALVTPRPIAYIKPRLYLGNSHGNYFQSHDKYCCNNLLHLVIDIQCTRYKNAFNKRFYRIVCQNNFAMIYLE